jgi:hypothetical protein
MNKANPSLIILLVYITLVAEVYSQCPSTCHEGNLYCEARFGTSLGGILSASCSGTRFTGCTCNGVTITANDSLGAPDCLTRGAFQESPNGAWCTQSIGTCPPAPAGVCPTNKYDLLAVYGEDCDGGEVNCTISTGVTAISCNTCSSQYLLLRNGTDCQRWFQRGFQYCDSVLHCGGHGCCRLDAEKPRCACYQDPYRGYWAGESCDRCAEDYGDPDCREHVQVVLDYVLNVRPSVLALPILMSSVIITVVLIIRSRWVSDEERYWVNRAVVSGSTFKSKAFPPRPAASRGVVNRLECARVAALKRGHTPTPSLE